jgi:hypothetical protein
VELRQAGLRSLSLFGSLAASSKRAATLTLQREDMKMKSLALYDWISSNQPDAKCEFAHGWWESAEFLQLLASDFEIFDFGVLTSYSMETPPPSSSVTMPVVSALAQNLEIYFKESWVVEPNYTVSVKWLLPGPLVLLDMLQPVDGQNRWLLRDFPTDYLYESFREGVSAFSGSVKNQHLLYALFHILTTQATEAF